MSSQVLWALDNEIEPHAFERLCADLLFRNGYQRIVPIEGPQDGARDAEVRPIGLSPTGDLVFFQFSLERDWRAKLRREVRKVAERDEQPGVFVLATSQTVRGSELDRLRAEVKQQYGWELAIYSREWLRLQLEEAHPDLAIKYLGVRPDVGTVEGGSTDRNPATPASDPTWESYRAGDYERAALDLKAVVAASPQRADAWTALAWSQYQLFRYDEALATINRAEQKLDGVDELRSVRACILAERGIATDDRATLVEARRIFEDVLKATPCPPWTLRYNLGNVHAALGDQAGAIAQYELAIQVTEDEPQVWKNLASAYHVQGDHEREATCFNRVLALDPNMPQALASRGICLLSRRSDPRTATKLIERALTIAPDFSVRHPQAIYWIVEGHRQAGDLRSALDWASRGLAQHPNHTGIRRQKSDLLHDIYPTDSAAVPTAANHWEDALAINPFDHEARCRLINLLAREGRAAEGWKLVEAAFELFHLGDQVPLHQSGFELEEAARALPFLPLYRHYRAQSPLDRYWNVADPINDLGNDPPDAPDIREALLRFVGIAFGLAAEALSALADPVGGEERAVAFVSRLDTELRRACVAAARFLAPCIPLSQGLNALADRVGQVLMFQATLGLREFGAINGWLGVQLGLSRKDTLKRPSAVELNSFQAYVASQSLVSINDELGFLPK